MSVFDDTVLVVHRPAGTIERRGNTFPDWTTTTDHTTGRGSLDVGDSTERHEHGETREVLFTWYGPIGSDVRAGDRVTVVYEGRTYDRLEVWGKPRPAGDGGLGIVAHLAVRLVEREG